MKLDISNLKKREKIFIVSLLVIIVALVYYRKFYSPHADEYRSVKSSLESAKAQKISVESDMPNIISAREALENKKALYKTTLGNIRKEEEKILAPAEIAYLLETIARSVQGLNIEIVYIQSKEPPKKEKKSYYTNFLIDFHYISSFASSVEYIRRLEKISNYLKIEEVKMEIEKEGEIRPHTYILLSTIINEKAAPKMALKEVMAPAEEMIEEAKKGDVFTTGEKPYKKELPVELKLSAILWSKENQTAIIDGKIKKVGDSVADKKIVEIKPDRVILKEGNRLYELMREK